MSTNSTSATAPNASIAPARRASLAAPDEEARQQVAWQREMERAQMATWFRSSVATRQENAATQADRTPSGPSRHIARTAEPGIGAPVGGIPSGTTASPGALFASRSPMVEPFVPQVSMQVPTATVHAATETRVSPLLKASSTAHAPVDAQIRRMGGPAQAAGEPVSGDAADATTEEAEKLRTPSAPGIDAQAPLRLHEEAMPEGQAVWIAMRADDDALAAMLPRIVADLERDMQQVRGQRLYQVVCNGRLVWRNDAAVEMNGTASIEDGDRRPSNVFDSIQPKGA